jgi:hypothetical protein
MVQSLEEKRKDALSFDRIQVAQVYLKSYGLYRHYFIELMQEAYNSFIHGCPRAAIIGAGEAMLRALLFWIEKLNGTGQIELTEKQKKSVVVDSKETISFWHAITILKDSNLYSKELIDKMQFVRILRNRATHSDFPIIDDWDPEDGSSEKEFIELLQGIRQIPEGYKTYLQVGNQKNFTFVPRDYACGSLKGLNYTDKYAIIQISLVTEILSQIYDNNENSDEFLY